jgi:phosphatidate cytidylyltransferase
MTRLVSGAVLLAVAVAVVWWAPPLLFFLAAEGVLLLALWEYAALARAGGLAIPIVAASAAAALTAAAFAPVVSRGATGVALDVVLMSALVALGGLTLATWRGAKDALAIAAASLFPSVYLGLPIGAMIAIREARGSRGLFLLMLAVIVSDTAQYYTGRAFGRRPLAPAVSPKKTREGAVGGFLAGAVFVVAAGRWWMPGTPAPVLAALGLALVAAGIAGDLFESMLKRSVGMKDSAALIPGHGGILDRIDALLFAAPVYYIALLYL